RPGGGPPRDPRDVQVAHRLCRSEPKAQRTGDLAARHGLLRRRDPDRRLVRAAQRLPQFSRRPHRICRSARRTLPGRQRAAAGAMVRAEQRAAARHARAQVGMIPLSVLDLSFVTAGGSGAIALNNSLDLARLADRLGFLRYWVAEHHNLPSIASSAPEIMIGPI